MEDLTYEMLDLMVAAFRAGATIKEVTVESRVDEDYAYEWLTRLRVNELWAAKQVMLAHGCDEIKTSKLYRGRIAGDYDDMLAGLREEGCINNGSGHWEKDLDFVKYGSAIRGEVAKVYNKRLTRTASSSRNQGRPAALDEEDKAFLMRILCGEPKDYCREEGVWTVCLLLQHLRECRGVVASRITMRRFLDEFGWEWNGRRYVRQEK